MVTNRLLTGAAALAVLVACHIEKRIPEKRQRAVRSDIECEIYRGYTNDVEDIPGRFIFDPLPAHARELKPRFALIGRPGLKDSLNTEETYCFITRNVDTLESIYSPIQPRPRQVDGPDSLH